MEGVKADRRFTALVGGDIMRKGEFIV